MAKTVTFCRIDHSSGDPKAVPFGAIGIADGQLVYAGDAELVGPSAGEVEMLGGPQAWLDAAESRYAQSTALVVIADDPRGAAMLKADGESETISEKTEDQPVAG